MTNTQSTSLFYDEREKSQPRQLRMYVTHPACGTTKMFRVEETLKILSRKDFRSISYETFCEKCGERVQVEIVWHALSPEEKEREEQLVLVSNETICFLEETGKQALDGQDLAEVIARAKKKWRGADWRV